MSYLRGFGLVAGALFATLLSASPLQATPLSFDALDDTLGVGSVQHDIVSFQADAFTSPGNVIFTVHFAGPIAAPSEFATNSVIGYIDIDTDRDPTTGAVPQVTTFGGSAIALGDEFIINLFGDPSDAGLVEVLDSMSNLVGTAPISYTSDSFTTTVPLALLGGVGLFNYGIVVGTYGFDVATGPEATDIAPNGTAPAVSVVPEPGGLTLAALGIASVFGYTRLRTSPRRS